MHAKTVTALLGLVSGVFVAASSIFSTEVTVFVCVLLSTQMMLWSVYKFIKRKNITQHKYGASKLATMIFIFSCFFVIGSLRTQFIIEDDVIVCDTPCEVKGIVTSLSERTGIYQKSKIKVNNEDRLHHIEVTTPLYPTLRVGDEVTLYGKVVLPHNQMPHQGEKYFDYVSYLRIHGIGSSMFYPSVKILPKDTNDLTFVYKLKRLQESCIHVISIYVREPVASLSSGMLFGGDSLSNGMKETFRVAGLSHIVVLSGFNIAILITFVLFVFRFLPLVIRVSFSFIFVCMFVLMVGEEVSIVRATIMSSIGLLALMLGRTYVAKQALILSLMAIILYEPDHLLYDVSLHLSFLATAGIIYISELFSKHIASSPLGSYKEIVTTTLSAYLATLPYSMYTFGTVSLYALFINVLVLPFVPLMMLLSFLVVTLGSMSHILGQVVGYVTTVLGGLIIFIAEVPSSLPFATVHLSLSFVSMISLYAVGIVLAILFFHFLSKNETRATKNDEIISDVMPY